MPLVLLLFSGCVGPVAIDRAVMSYDSVSDDLISRQLLLNIARASNNQPLHFTGLSNIAATFNFQLTAGATPPLGGTEGGFALAPLFGSVFAENPTFSVVPIEGEEFTKRLLAPFPEGVLTMLLRQGTDVDLALRMMAGEYRTYDETRKAVSFGNRPSDKLGYAAFRRIVLHLSTIQDRHALYAEPLIFEESWTMPAGQVNAEALQSLVKEFSVSYEERGRLYRVTKRNVGRVIVTNYDPKLLPNDDRARLNGESEESGEDEVLVDVRPGYPGGEYPLHGRFRLRSFSNVISFLGRTLSEEPEYDVEKDSRSPATSENPTFTLALVESDTRPAGADRTVQYGGHYYAVRPQEGYQWNRKAFVFLHQLFQLSVAKLSQSGAPTITIAK